jgi:hypothetical protein
MGATALPDGLDGWSPDSAPATVSDLRAMGNLALERVEHPNAGAGDVGYVPRDKGQVVHLGGRGHEPVDACDRIRHVQSSPLLGDLGRDRDDAIAIDPTQHGQPRLVHLSLRDVASAEPLDALSDLTNHQDADVQVHAGDRTRTFRSAAGF